MTKKSIQTILGAAVLLLLFVAGCNKKRPSANANNVSQDTVVPQPDINRTVSLAKIEVDSIERFGLYLTDAKGRALYMFTGDTRGKSSACYVNCSEAWPPLLTTDKPVAVASAVNKNMLGTIKRHDGSLQVTYNGWPLYYFKKDQGQGEITGQDVNGFGGDWYLMSPNGSFIAPHSNENPKVRK